MTCEDCNCINEGDWVESKLNTDVFGIVVGSTGMHLSVQLSPFLNIVTYHVDTLRRIDCPLGNPGGREDLPTSDDGGQDNVIDFTKARKLRADTKTKGAA